MAYEIAKFLGAAWEAADAAGTLIRESWQQPKEIGYKGAIDLVTSVDRESERRIVDILQRNFPDHSILAEEETNLVGAKRNYRWIIDPLDGTTNFAHGYPQFCISIALEYDGKIVLGLVYDPMRRECFRAVKGQGATLNGSAIQTSDIKELNKALLATGFPYDGREKADLYLTFFKEFMTRSQGIRRAGSAARAGRIPPRAGRARRRRSDALDAGPLGALGGPLRPAREPPRPRGRGPPGDRGLANLGAACWPTSGSS